MHKPKLVFLLFLGFLASCIDARQKALQGTLATVDAMRDGFVVWDDVHQSDLVDDASSLEEGKEALTKYRKQREKVLFAFETVYRLIAIALIDENNLSLNDVTTAVSDVYTTIEKLTGD